MTTVLLIWFIHFQISLNGYDTNQTITHSLDSPKNFMTLILQLPPETPIILLSQGNFKSKLLILRLHIKLTIQIFVYSSTGNSQALYMLTQEQHILPHFIWVIISSLEMHLQIQMEITGIKKLSTMTQGFISLHHPMEKQVFQMGVSGLK